MPNGQVKSHLVMAILATLFCCLPFGIVGIVFASQVGSKLAAGDYAGAQKASKSAATWSWVAIGLGLVGGILYAVLISLPVGTVASSCRHRTGGRGHCALRRRAWSPRSPVRVS
jgi:hypothetical protein